MPATRRVVGRIAATLLAGAVIGCAVPQGAVLQGGEVGTFDQRIDRGQDYEREAGPMGGMDYSSR